MGWKKLKSKTEPTDKCVVWSGHYLTDFIFSGFMQENPDGVLRKDKMFAMYREVLSETKAKMFVNQIFSKERFKYITDIFLSVCWYRIEGFLKYLEDF